MEPTLRGKVILLTGGTEGIGKAAAKALAGMGATLVLTARDRAKGERVVAELGGAPVSLLIGDLSSMADVRAVAAAFRAQHDRLDVLINNAGAVFTEHALTVDGFERTFALDHLSPFLLTHELRDLLQRTPGARVITTSSGAHQAGRIDLETVATRPNGKAGFGAYGDAKLANVLFTRELARRLTGVMVCCYHPGWVWTGFGLNNGGWLAAGIRLAAPWLARTPEKGAETMVWLASAPEAVKHHGGYLHDKRPAKLSARAQDDALAAGLWALSERLCGIG